MSAYSRGFSIVGIVTIVVGICLVGLIGYTIVNRLSIADGNQSPTASDVQMAPSISSAADLDSVGKMLDGIDVEAANKADVEQLDTELGAF